MQIQAPETKVEEALKAIQRKGGSVRMSNNKGSISIQGVEANFAYDDKTEVLEIEITDKPWLASMSMIESEIQKFFK